MSSHRVNRLFLVAALAALAWAAELGAQTPFCTPEWESGLPGTDARIFDLLEFDDGSGPALYACGDFVEAGGLPASNIARWDGSAWSPLGDGLGGRAFAIKALDAGDGLALYAVGDFLTAGGASAIRVARWDGSAWSALGGGFSAFTRALAAYDDGSGTAIYVGGDFPGHIARWDGSTWTTVGGGTNERVRTLLVYDDGSGSGAQLYAGGDFTTAGGVAASHIARWNGTAWAPVGGGLGGSFVFVLTAVETSGPFGPGIYAGGRFTSAGGVPAENVAFWDGSTWSALGAGAGDGSTSDVVREVVYHDAGDGSGPGLYVGGDFTTAGGQPMQNVALWRDGSWSDLDGGTDTIVRALASVYDPAAGRTRLYAGGDFTTTGSWPALYFGQWGCPAAIFERGDANGDGEENIADAIFIIQHLFALGPQPSCADAADTNDDGAIDIADPIVLLNQQFNAGPPPAPPYPDCGTDGDSSDSLDCVFYSPCPS